MTEMTLTVPPAMEDYLRERVAAGDFVDTADYVRDLIRADQRSLADLRTAIDEGLASGDSERTVDQIFDGVIARRDGAYVRGLIRRPLVDDDMVRAALKHGERSGR